MGGQTAATVEVVVMAEMAAWVSLKASIIIIILLILFSIVLPRPSSVPLSSFS